MTQVAAASPDGRYTVEVAELDTGWWLLLRDYGFCIAQVRTPDDLAKWVDLAELEMV